MILPWIQNTTAPCWNHFSVDGDMKSGWANVYTDLLLHSLPTFIWYFVWKSCSAVETSLNLISITVVKGKNGSRSSIQKINTNQLLSFINLCYINVHNFVSVLSVEKKWPQLTCIHWILCMHCSSDELTVPLDLQL